MKIILNPKDNPLFQLFIYACIVATGLAIIQLTPLRDMLHYYIWIIYFFLLCLSVSTTGMTYMLYQKSRRKFRMYYLLIITARLLIAMSILGYAVYMNIYQLKSFTINYFVIYILFVIFELYSLNINMSRKR